MSSEPSSRDMSSSVFLSYSRADGVFVARLARALNACGFTPVYDLSDNRTRDPTLVLTAQDEWWVQLKRMIAASDVFVFVVSPASVRSAACDDEIAYARGLGKRVIPIIRAAVDLGALPERLRALNIQLSFEDDARASFRRALDSLLDEIKMDIEWHRRGANLLRIAQQWESDGTPEGQLLRVGSIETAMAWITGRPANTAPAPELLLKFIAASREKEAGDNRKVRENLARAYLKLSQLLIAEQAYARATITLAAGLVLLDEKSHDLIESFHDVAVAAAAQNRLVVRMTAKGVALCNIIPLSSKQQWLLVNFANRGGCYDPVSGFRETAELEDYLALRTGLYLCGGERDGDPYFAVSSHGDFYVHNMRTGEPIGKTWNGRTDKARFAADMRFVATSTSNGIYLLDHALRPLSSFKASSFLRVFELSPSGSRILTADYARIPELWDSLAGQRKRLLREVGETAHCACFSTNSSCVAIGGGDGLVHLFRASDGRLKTKFAASDARIAAMAFSQDGRKLAIVDSENRLSLWSLSPPVRHFELELPFYDRRYNRNELPEISDIAFIEDDMRIMTLLNGDALVWDAAISRVVRTGQLPATARLAAQPLDGAVWMIAVDTNDSFVVWRIGDDGLTRKRRVACDTRTVTSLAYDPVRHIAASSHREGVVRFHDLASGRLLRELATGGVQCDKVVFSDDGRRCAIVGADHTVRTWEWRTGTSISTCAGHHAYIVDVKFSRDGERLATFNADGELPDDRHGFTNDNTVRVWEVETGKQLDNMQFNTRDVCDVVFGERDLLWIASSVLGKQVALGTSGRSGHSRDLMSGGFGGEPVFFEEAFFSRDASMFVSYHKRTVTIWSSLSARPLERIGVAKEIGWLQLAGSPPSRLLILFKDRTFEWLDISRAALGTFGPREIVLAGLARARDAVSSKDRMDPLFADIPDSLQDELREQMSDLEIAQAEQLAGIEARPLHRRCYDASVPANTFPGQ